MYFQFGPILKKMNQITVPKFFTLAWKDERQQFCSFLWGWNQIENTFQDYPTFQTF